MSAPQWTPELMRELAAVALELAITPPERFSQVGHSAIVWRSDVSRLRGVLDRAGVDWRTLKRQVVKATREAARAPVHIVKSSEV